MTPCSFRRPNRRSALRPRPDGWTLQETLIIVGIIVTLATILLPALGNVREVARRTNCRANVRGFANACVIYAQGLALDSGGKPGSGAFPLGRIDDPSAPPPVDPGDGSDPPAEKPDNYVRISTSTFTMLRDDKRISNELATCTSIELSNTVMSQDWRFNTGGDDMCMGMIYWGGRADVPGETADDPTYFTPYAQDVKRRNPATGLLEEYQATSMTLVTCMMYDVNAGGNAEDQGPESFSMMPHVRSECNEIAGDEPVEDFSDGVAVGFSNGTARWVDFSDLRPLDQHQRVWYAPQ